MTDKLSDRGAGRFKWNAGRSDKNEAGKKGWNYRGYYELGRNLGSWKLKHEQYKAALGQ